MKSRKGLKFVITCALTLAIMLAQFSCSKFMDIVPEGTASLDNVFSNRDNAIKYLATCYHYIPKMFVQAHNPALYGCDETVKISDEKKYGMAIAYGLQNAGNPYCGYWGGTQNAPDLFKGIRVCNTLIANIHRVPDLLAPEKARWSAEAKVLKAYYHFLLFRAYGAIPIIRDNLAIAEDPGKVAVYREPVGDVVDYIANTIDEAVPDLPARVPYETSEYNRLTKAAAMAVKADALLTAASDLFNGNPVYKDIEDNRGVKLFSQTKDKELWRRAASAYKKAIDYALEGGFRLVSTSTLSEFNDLNPEMELRMVLRSIISSSSVGEEKLFRCAWHHGSISVQNESLFRIDGDNKGQMSSRNSVSMRIVEQFYTKDGIPINESDPSRWDYGKRYDLVVARDTNRYHIGGNGTNANDKTTAYLHFKREPRFYAFISFDRAMWYGQGKNNLLVDEHNGKEGQWMVKARGREKAGYRAPDKYSLTGYVPKKLVNYATEYSASGSVIAPIGFNMPLYRLGEMYLGYAEALNEYLDAPNDSIYVLVNTIRTRAGLLGVEESWSNYASDRYKDKYTTKAGMRDIIRQERTIELSFENKRFWDIRRWKTAAQELAVPIKGWTTNIDEPNPKVEHYYTQKNVTLLRFTEKDYLWPIPDDELFRNPNLVQNYGW